MFANQFSNMWEVSAWLLSFLSTLLHILLDFGEKPGIGVRLRTQTARILTMKTSHAQMMITKMGDDSGNEDEVEDGSNSEEDYS